jgi:hypothetical protein
LMLPIACTRSATFELIRDPASPPSVKMAVAAEYRRESMSRHGGNTLFATRRSEAVELHVMDASGKLSSEMW